MKGSERARLIQEKGKGEKKNEHGKVVVEKGEERRIVEAERNGNGSVSEIYEEILEVVYGELEGR